MNDDELETSVREALLAMETSGEPDGSRMFQVARLVASQPAGTSGPRLLFGLGRMVCALPLDRAIVVGRKGTNLDLAIPDPSLSRQHFQVVVRDEERFVKDMESRNGIKVNGHAVVEHRLEERDVIEAGTLIFVFVREDPDA